MYTNVLHLLSPCVPEWYLRACDAEGREMYSFVTRKIHEGKTWRRREKDSTFTHRQNLLSNTSLHSSQQLAITDTLSLPFSLVDHRLDEEEREKERVASQKRRMPIIGNGRPHLATFALLDVDTGLTDRPVNHHRFTLTFYRSHACSYLLYGSRLVIFVWPSNRPGTRTI